jgi:regulator of protease activity HflC (stomatin/prohibitin superfamily)
MNLLEIVAQFFQYVTAWIPRPRHVVSVERHVRWRFGNEPTLIGPGLYAEVPLFERWEAYSVLWDANEFRPCVLVTADGREVAVGFVLIWRIAEPLTTATTIDDAEAMVGEVGESLLPDVISAHNWADLMGSTKKANQQLKTEANRLLREYGLEVKKARINNLARCRVHRVIQND